LKYIGVYPARAGHDYAAIAQNNFRQMVIERDGQAVTIKRTDWLESQHP
jgi:hypothetical protein